MHRCLEIQEILQMILQCLYDSGYSGSVVSMAATCRAFHESAIEVLWRSIRFEYLVKCLPADLWYVRVLEDSADREKMLEDEEETGPENNEAENDEEMASDDENVDSDEEMAFDDADVAFYDEDGASDEEESESDEGDSKIVRPWFRLHQLHTELLTMF
jgi:hypothetical protein